MNRRKFIKDAALAAGSLSLTGLELQSAMLPSLMNLMAAASTNSKTVVLINMLGGNDGLNTIIPVGADGYSQYANWRPNLKINQNDLLIPQNLPSNKTIGFHPAMTGFYNLFSQDKLAVIQNVSYPNHNQSHFRSRDIWLSGSNSDDFWGSGWLGRYFDTIQWSSADPIAIEVSPATTLSLYDSMYDYHGINFENPVDFYNLVNGFPANSGNFLPDGYMGDEAEYILGVEAATNAYATQLYNRYQAGGQTTTPFPSTYNSPNGYQPFGYLSQNYLGQQLEIVARLIRGGCQTKVYLCNIHGFDTHAQQIYSSGIQDYASDGRHAALLYYLSASVEAFLSNLANRGQDVMLFTMSEFGRRVYDNSSKGSDHGNAAPLFIAGDCVKGGVYNNNPDLSSSVINGNNGNIPMSTDFRNIFATMLIDWYGCDASTVKNSITNGGIGWADDLDANGLADIIENRIHYIESQCIYNPPLANQKKNNKLELYPNPADNYATIRIHNAKSKGTLRIYSLTGSLQQTTTIKADALSNGYSINVQNLAAGTYIIEVALKNKVYSKRLVKV